MKLIEDKEWDPEIDVLRPELRDETVVEPEIPGGDEKPDDNGNNNNNNGNNNGNEEDKGENDTTVEPELNWFQKIIKAIVDFFNKIFGGIFGKN